jgi:hypothetical protein
LFFNLLDAFGRNLLMYAQRKGLNGAGSPRQVCGGPNPAVYEVPRRLHLLYAHEECYEKEAREAEARIEARSQAWRTSSKGDPVVVFFAIIGVVAAFIIVGMFIDSL